LFRKSKPSESTVDLFDIIRTEPLKVGEEVRSLVGAEPGDETDNADTSIFTLDVTMLSGSTTTTSYDPNG
jgi:hypothetical protein